MKRTDIKKILIIGSGPIVIGQAAEFDYAGTQACLALKEEGYEVILVNSNPATIMTDTSIADKVYMEPLTLEYVAKIIRYERPDAIVPGIGGQTGLNLAMQLERKGVLRECGVELLGTSSESIEQAEDREKFKELCQSIGEPVIPSEITYSLDGKIVTLKEGEDYTITKSGEEGQWKKYLYRIKASCFEEEGNYVINIYSEDAAHNSTTNKTKAKTIAFTVDKTAPTMVVSNLTDRGRYKENMHEFTLNVKDNIFLAYVEVYLDGELFKRFEEDEIAQLNGELPVEVTLVKIPEKKIVFDSRDMDVHGEFDTIEPLQRTGDPYDSFALQKACLLACGILPAQGGDLSEILERLGGGFEMHSEVTNVPKGSGLGTSSILSAACVKAVFEFMGISYSEADLYAHVLVMEQIMSTGGGWQDQVGGVTNGIKYITSTPGLNQQIKVQHIELKPETRQELNERFCLIYTGQRRLARNLLRDVVGRYVGNEPDSLFALNEIQKVAALMRFELERGNIDEFARLLNYHWELSQKVDAGSTNTLIDQIFLSIEDLIDAKMVCGAGGGGFLQVILKKGVSGNQVHSRLKEVFQDNPVDVWECEII